VADQSQVAVQQPHQAEQDEIQQKKVPAPKPQAALEAGCRYQVESRHPVIL
jgi:hypothetical protein